MSDFIKLTAIDDTSTLINLDKVVYCETVLKNSKEYTRIIFEDFSELVKETCDEIQQLILIYS